MYMEQNISKMYILKLENVINFERISAGEKFLKSAEIISSS